mmetsp:Transcript_15228/g.26023  ORF Transcript_15228/g.26023 Transcript_15228/m.26023 type:complete len:247 (+) Transcript_15228:1010-1750(+)
MGLGEFVTICVEEASNTRAKNLGSDQSCDTSSHVDNTGSSEVVHTTAECRIVIEGREETRRTPDGVHNNGVDKSREHQRVAKVGLELATFGDSTGHNGSSGRGKRKLEEPTDEVASIHEVSKEEPGVTNEALLVGRRASIGKSVSNRPKAKGTTTGVENVLEHNVLDILLANASSAEHGEASLHEEDHGGGEEKVEDIETGVGFVRVGEGGADTGFGALSFVFIRTECFGVEIRHGGYGLMIMCVY